jgi:hypothetical protein
MIVSAERRKALVESVAKLRARPAIRRTLTGAQYALLAAIFIYLIWRVSHLGWKEVLDELPTTPWFYVFFGLRFLAGPLCELAAYEINWDQPLVRHILVFIRKRVYNYAVAGYTGEGFLTLWARRSLNVSERDILIGVKDNTLLAGLTSNVSTVLFIVALAASGVLRTELEELPGAAILFALAFLTAAGVSAAVIIFRRRLIALPEGKLRAMLAIHVVRQALMFLLQAAMYAAAIPEAPLLAWAMFVTMQLVTSRIPFLPNQDLVYLGAALSISSAVGAPETAVAGMLIAEGGLLQMLNVGLFFATAFLARQKPVSGRVPLAAPAP